MNRLICALAFCALGLTSAAASAADTKVTILSDPPGAMVYGTGIDGIERPFGYAPIIITVLLAKTKDGCRDTGQMRVHWVSGAEASVPSLHVCKKTPGKEPIMFFRPTGVPGLEADARFGLDLVNMAEAKRQALLGAYLAALSHNPPPPPMVPYVMPPPSPAATVPTQVHCTSNIVGTYIYTTCS
jgi:hypothetical protein